MKRSLGFLSVGVIVASMAAMNIQACASDDNDDNKAGSGGGTAKGGNAGNAGNATGGTGGSAGAATGGTGGSAGAATGGTGEGGAATGGTGEGGAATGGTGGGGTCPVGQAATVADIANGIVGSGIEAQITGAIATSKKVLAYFSKTKGTCLWGVFVKDPTEPRGLMVISYGDDAPDGSENASACPTGTDAIPNEVVPGDVVDILGETNAFVSSKCSGVVPPAQIQLKACSMNITATGGEAPEPVVVTDLDAVAGGAAEYQGLLIKIEDVTAENYDGGTVGPFGVIQLEGTELQVNDKFYFVADGAPVFEPSQHFNSIVGIAHLDFCNWVLQPRDKCNDFDPPSTDCP